MKNLTQYIGKNSVDNKLAYYGKSMYGGWYADCGTWAIHGETLKDIKKQAKIDGYTLLYRRDN